MEQVNTVSEKLVNEFGFCLSNENALNLIGEIKPNNILLHNEGLGLNPKDAFSFLVDEEGSLSESIILLGLFNAFATYGEKSIRFNISYVENGKIRAIKNAEIINFSLERICIENNDFSISFDSRSLVSFELANVKLSDPIRAFLKSSYHLFLTIENMTEFVYSIVSQKIKIGSTINFHLKNRVMQRGTFLGISERGEIMINIYSRCKTVGGLGAAFGGIFEFNMEKVQRIELEK